MKTIRLHGDLAEKFGDTWHLDVRTPQEAFRGIAANRPDLMPYLYAAAQRGEEYSIVAGDHDIDEDSFFGPFSSKEVLHITPIIKGSKSGIAGILVGVAFIVASFIPGLNVAVWAAAPEILGVAASTVTWASVAYSIGTSLVLGGISKMLAGSPEAPTQGFSPGDTKPGYYFNGPTENKALGSAIPVGYGIVLAGSQSISNGLAAEDMI